MTLKCPGWSAIFLELSEEWEGVDGVILMVGVQRG